VQRWQRVAVLVVVAWMLAVGAWANRSWTETIPLVTPPETEGQSRSFVCGAPFAARSAEPEESGPLDHPLSRQPCEVNGERRVVAIVDLALGAVVLAGVVYAGRRSSARRDPQPVA
jgi:hypothetical protein